MIFAASSALAAPQPMTRTEIIDLAKSGVDYSYWWGHGCWRLDGTQHGSCSGGCPDCTHTGSYGADCSGFAAKVWQVPSPSPIEDNAHPYSTREFRYNTTHWDQVARDEALRGDCFVYRNSSNTARHIVVYESGDAGAFYVGRDWTQRGTVLRYNYWHQIVGATGHGGMTIYLDDQHCGHTIHGNLFERCSRAVFIGGGDDNVVTNNVFIDCWRAAHIDNRGMGWQKKATDDPNGTLRKRLRSMPYTSDLWRRRYPTLPGILEDDPNIPKRNVFARNISAGGVWDDIHKGTRQYQTVKDNLVVEAPTWITLTKDAGGRIRSLRFADPAQAKAIGFTPLPVDKMGVYEDPRRASWPVVHEVRPVSLPDK